MKKVRKAVFPVAGMGTRFLPATKASPKEMLPIVDKPLIQFAVEEAVAAGITDMVFVTGRSKRSIEDHFDKAYELESELEARGKRRIARFRPQHDPQEHQLHLHPPGRSARSRPCRALRQAGDRRRTVRGACLPTTCLMVKPPVMKQMTDTYDYYRCSVLGVQDVPRADTGSYGIVDARKRG